RQPPALAVAENPEVAARALVLGVDLAGRQLEVPRQLRAVRAVRDLADALAEDPHALLHLLHLHPVPVPAIADGPLQAAADADVEVEAIVHRIGPLAPQVERDAAA